MGGRKAGSGPDLVVGGEVFDRLTRKAPVSVIGRAAMENALSRQAMDDLFGAAAKDGYTRALLFSSLVNLMSLVVCRIRASVHAAFQKLRSTMPVTVQAVYEKLARIEPGVCAALVQHVATRLGAVIDKLGGGLRTWLASHPVRIVDGAHLAATERRLEVLRGSVAGPLPGHSLVVLDPSRMPVTDVNARRWTLETAFQEIEKMLNGEIEALAYPRLRRETSQRSQGEGHTLEGLGAHPPWRPRPWPVRSR